MTINKVLEYIFHTPFNTNRAVLIEMLKRLIVFYGGSIDGLVPEGDVIYDGGIEQ